MLRAEEVCQLFGWNAGQLYMAVRRGHVPARKMGRRVVFLRTELEAHLAQLPHVVETNVPWARAEFKSRWPAPWRDLPAQRQRKEMG